MIRSFFFSAFLLVLTQFGRAGVIASPDFTNLAVWNPIGAVATGPDLNSVTLMSGASGGTPTLISTSLFGNSGFLSSKYDGLDLIPDISTSIQIRESVQNGAAIFQKFSGNAGDKITFRYDTSPFSDRRYESIAFVSLNGTLFELGRSKDVLSNEPFTLNIDTTSSNHLIGFGVIDIYDVTRIPDTLLTSDLVIKDLQITADTVSNTPVPEPTSLCSYLLIGILAFKARRSRLVAKESGSFLAK